MKENLITASVESNLYSRSSPGKALSLWIEDLSKKKCTSFRTLDSVRSKESYRSLRFSRAIDETVIKEDFFASIKLVGEAASADFGAARFPEELGHLIREKGYQPDPIFNADEAGHSFQKLRELLMH